MAIKIGDKLPSVTVAHMTDSGPEDISTDALFAGKKVVLFAVPGAFTPTCSASHLPGFVAKADEIKSTGVHEIICLSVNDAFVMDAWGKSQNAGSIHLVADGSAELTRAMGLEFDLTARGLGVRSNRYAMVIEDGVVISLDIDEGGKLEVSSAETVLGRLR